MADPGDPLRVPREVLDGGLTVARQSPPPGSQSVAISYVGPAGWGYDPEGREGTAVQVAQLLTSGAGRLDREALARELDRLGGTLTARTAPESVDVTVWGPGTAWKPLLGLLADAVQRPRFAPDDVERVRRQMVERQLREVEQPADRCEKECLHAIFPRGHPYRETGSGDRKSLARVRRADLQRFHRARFAAEGAIVVGTLGVSADDFRRAVRARFDALPARSPPTISTAEVSSLRAAANAPVVVTMPGRSQVEIRIGGPSIARGSPSYPAAFLAEEVLGGRGMLSRLFQHIREEQGLAYHASSELEAMRFGGYWMARAGTGPERRARVAELLRGEVARLSQERVAQAELDLIRESAIGEIPLALETTAGAHELAVDLTYHDLPVDFYAHWPETLRRLGPREVQRAAGEAFDPDRSVLVEAGPAESTAPGGDGATRTHTHK